MRCHVFMQSQTMGGVGAWVGAQAVQIYGVAVECPPGLRLGAVSPDRAGHPALSL